MNDTATPIRRLRAYHVSGNSATGTGSGKRFKVKGFEFKMLGFEDFRFICNRHTSIKLVWVVSEFHTGLRICEKSFESDESDPSGVIDDAMIKIANKLPAGEPGKVKLRELIKRHIDVYGYANS